MLKLPHNHNPSRSSASNDSCDSSGISTTAAAAAIVATICSSVRPHSHRSAAKTPTSVSARSSVPPHRVDSYLRGTTMACCACKIDVSTARSTTRTALVW